MDIWGPYKEVSFIGAKYFLTIVDDYIRATWAFKMHLKGQATSILSKFIHMIKTQFNATIKIVRTHNSNEFLSQACFALFNTKGIIHHRSCPYTPQQNGMVERKYRHVLNIARALRIQSNVLKLFWSECILTATYVINRLPIKKLGWLSPYHKLFGKVPPYTHLRKFEC